VRCQHGEVPTSSGGCSVLCPPTHRGGRCNRTTQALDALKKGAKKRDKGKKFGGGRGLMTVATEMNKKHRDVGRCRHL